MNKEILINIDKCMGCRSCELACAVAHSESKTLLGAVLGSERPKKRIHVQKLGSKAVPINCRHCQDAPCIDACITGAMHRTTDQLVTNLDGEQPCSGCWMCVMVCPYGVIRSLPDQRQAIKCDRACLNETGVPACVAACPTKALTFGSVDEYSAAKRQLFMKGVFIDV